MNSFPDYYTVLGVATDAPPEAIKAAFKKLALQYHPDLYKGEDAHERMRVLLLAYQTLNDPAARRQYDAQRSEHIHDGRGYRSSSSPAGRPARSAPSPKARRDRQRHYDFPDFQPGRAVHIDLIDFAYTLSPQEAHTLQQEGLLRGFAPEDEAHKRYCHRCHQRWSATGNERFCPHCKSGDWSEYLLLRCQHCSAVFESEQIRYEVASINYGKGHPLDTAGLCPPYELFPLCPYCGTARWCPAEDRRVQELRVRAQRRAAALRAVWISVAVVLVVVVGVAVLMLR
jgi:curved DNA-binding protein CbpA